MAKHGLRSAAKRDKLLAAAQDDANAALDAAVCQATGGDMWSKLVMCVHHTALMTAIIKLYDAMQLPSCCLAVFLLLL